ncbi:MAG TPA: hypothetical protein VF334_17040, partial [Polyangia bacterium]
KERDARYFHCDEFLAALESVPEARRSTAPRKSGSWLGATVAVLAVAGGAAAWVWNARMTPRELTLPHAEAAPAAPPAPLPIAADLAVVVAAPTPPVAAPTPPVAAPTPPAATPPPPTPVESVRDHVAALLAADKLADAERLLRAEAILDPHAGWVHLDLGEVYFRRLWRKDAEKEWDTALTLDPSLRADAQLADHVCALLGPQWAGAGQRLVVRHLGAAAIAPLTDCAHSSDPTHAQAAARLLDRVKRR